MARVLVQLTLCVLTAGYQVPLAPSRPSQSLQGFSVLRVADGKLVDLGQALLAPRVKTLIVLGTYPADFNMVRTLSRSAGIATPTTRIAD